MSNINFQNCNLVEVGTSLPDCLLLLGEPKGFILTKKSWTENVSTDLDKAYFQQKIQEGIFIPFLNAFSFEDTTPEATTEESSNGSIKVVRDPKPQFNIQYSRSVHFNKILTKYNSYEQYNVLLVFDNDVIFCALSADETEVSGLRLGQLHTAPYKHNTGSETGKSMTMMQLLDTNQYNEGAVLDPNFNVNTELYGIMDVVVAGTSASGSVSFSVTSKVNPAVNIKGLAEANLRLVVDGTAEAITNLTYDDVSNQYTGDPTNAFTGGEEVVVELYDSIIPANVAVVGDRFYKGKSSAITAVA